MTTLPTKFIDYNANRKPKTNRFCVACQKDLKGNPKRFVHIVNGGLFALHPSFESAYVADAGDMGWHEIGADCAKILGIQWTHRSKQ